MKIFRQTISVVLVTLMLLSTIIVAPLTVNAAESSDIDMGDDMEVSGTNSLGNMLADEYAESTDEESEDTVNNIFDTSVEGNTVYVNLQTQVDALLVVALYDDLGQYMYTSSRLEVTPENTIVNLDFEMDSMPDSFLIRAYLLDKATDTPLCKVFECDTYTAKMQEFFSKTTEDFDEEKVLNLDEDTTNNFLVYNDETILTEGTDDTNVVASTDEADHIYIFENIDESISSLNEGDIFSHSYDDGEGLIIIKVSSISIDGTTATINGEELKMADVFDYVKIDIAESIDDPEVDNSDIDEGVEYIGMETLSSEASDKSELAPVGYPIINGDLTFKTGLTYSLNKNIGKSKITGTASAGFFVAVSCYYDVKLFEENELKMSFRLGYELDINAKFELVSLSTTLKLGTLKHIPIPGVSIEFTPALVLKGEVTVTVNDTISGHVGKKLNNGRLTDDTKPARLKMGLSVEGSLFLGLAFEPAVKLLHSVVKIYAEVEVGIEVTAELKYEMDTDTDKEEIHLCTSCIDGGVYFKINFTFGIELFDDGKDDDKDKEECKWESELSFKNKLCSFYFSFDNMKLGWGSCPNNSYRQTVTIVGTDKKPVAGVKVNGVKTDVKGRAAIYLTTGTHTIRVTDGDIANAFTLKVNGVGSCIYTIGEDITILPKPSTSSKPGSGGSGSSSGSHGSGGGSGAIVDSVQPAVMETGKCGDNLIYEFYSDGTLIISGTGALEDDGPLPYDDSIKKVILKDGVTRIGDDVFEGCHYLTDIVIPDSVTSLGSDFIWGCHRLKSIRIPRSVTDIHEDAFGINCLEEIVVDEDNPEYCSVDGVLFNKNRTTILRFPREKVQKSYTIPYGVTKIGEYAFYFCDALTDIIIPDSVISIGDSAFTNCASLTEITIPHGVTEIGSFAFSGCESLVSIKIPDGVTSVGHSAFAECVYLTEITLPDSVTSIGIGAFEECVSLKSINIPNGVTRIWSETFKGCISLKSIKIPDSVTRIDDSLFEECTSLKSVTLSNNITSISEKMFYNCESLTSIVIPDGVTSIGERAFFSCDSLINITIPDSVASVGNSAFSYCYKLTNIRIPNNATNIGDGAFSSCYSLTDIDVDSGNPEYCSVDGVLFNKDCTAILQYPKGKEQKEYIIPKSVKNIGEDAFYSCENLTSVIISDGVTSIGDYAFYSCHNLTSITIPDGVTSIGDYAFYSCDKMTSVIIPDSVTKIGANAFSWCFNLTDVYYMGSESDWSSIDFKYSSDYFETATIHFNSTGTSAKAVSSIASVGASVGDADGIVVLSENISDTTKSHTRKHLVPGTEAVLVIMEGLEDECSVSESPILYIAQTTVDANGEATFTSYGDYSDKYWVAMVYGQCAHPEYKWEIFYDATDYLDGLEVYACTICGGVSDFKEIPAKNPEDITTPSQPGTSQPTKPIITRLLGDVKEDDKVNVKDATLIQKYAAALETLSDIQLVVGDVNADTKVNVKDATAIQKYAASIETGYPIGEPIAVQ